MPACQGCRPAYSFAAALTGTINLAALLVAPLLSLIRGAPARFLSGTAALGALCFLLIGRGRDADPRSAASWIAAVGIGIAQMTAVVLSLGVVSAARRKLLQSASKERRNSEQPSREARAPEAADEHDEKEEIAGALAGASSFCGGEWKLPQSCNLI